MKNSILHCDLNCFYASVEMLHNPQYKNVPMAVCGDPSKRHGIILARNELAKKFNVFTTQTIYQAKKNCPNLVLRPPRHNEYEYFSKKVNEVYLSFTDKVEPFGIDESWLDVSGSRNLFGTGFEIAKKIKDKVSLDLSLSLSIGVSFNKVFAKLGSDYKKPDAITVISRENFKDLLWNKPVGDMFYVGKSTAKKLENFSVMTIGDLAGFPKELLIKNFGKQGELLHIYANGLDLEEVDFYEDKKAVKSIAHSETFPRDLSNIRDLKNAILAISKNISLRLIEKNLKAQSLMLSLKDSSFKVHTMQKKMPYSTSSSKFISQSSNEILQILWKSYNVRMIGITAIGLSKNDKGQSDFFSDKIVQKQEFLEKTINNIKTKYGVNIIKNMDL